ncbi:hypothetical protein H9P43_005131 [Blastocladiella emersonii ATCC 22665]|nr:hypothetical protein H9P43_005131 [Blastocladiella emersonii ATCC 22665]
MDHYTLLSISRDASVKDVKDAFRNLKDQYDGKKDKRSQEKFVAIKYAYKVLSEPIERRKYDAERFGDTTKYGIPMTKNGPKDKRYVHPVALADGGLKRDKRFA